MTAAIFFLTLAVLVGGYAIWKSLGRALSDMETRQIARDCRISFRDGGRYMGSDRR